VSGPGHAPVRIGTRGSPLALVQASLVREALEAQGVPCTLVTIETEGDRRLPDTPWGEGAFVAAIERALLDDRVDVAVHSAKDVPIDEDARLRIRAFLPRADPHDVLVLPAGSEPRTLEELPAGASVGTDSPRRAGFLRAARPDLSVRPLHGNVETRLRRLDEGQVDALVLAAAGLERLGLHDRVSARLPEDLLPPAPGQGAIAVQVRAADPEIGAAVARIDDRATRLAVEAERALLAAAGGGCRAPVGALARVEGDRIVLRAGFTTEDGRAAVFATTTASSEDVRRAAQKLAQDLGARRQRALAASVRSGQPALRRPHVLVTRPEGQLAPFIEALEERGIRAVVVPAIAIEPAAPGSPLDDALLGLRSGDRAIVTSPSGARAVIEAALRLRVDLSVARWVAVGVTSARILEEAGAGEVWRPRRASGAGISDELVTAPGERILLLRGSLADESLPARLHDRGVQADEVEAYRTIEAPPASGPLLERAMSDGPLEAVLFASGSAVRGLLSLAGSRYRERVLSLPAICLGPETAMVAGEHGFRVLGEAPMQAAAALAETCRHLLAATQDDAVPGEAGDPA
jgi:hydroxymethylbilane synthase